MPATKKKKKRQHGGWRTRQTYPAGPLREWLQERLEGYDSVADMAKALGMSERRLRALLSGEYSTVGINQVDRLLLKTDIMLDDLYPLDQYPERRWRGAGNPDRSSGIRPPRPVA